MPLDQSASSNFVMLIINGVTDVNGVIGFNGVINFNGVH